MSIITQIDHEVFITELRGVEYYLKRCVQGNWEVHSNRKGLGPRNVGTWKFFKTLQEVSQNVRAFRGIDLLVGV